MFLWGHGGGGGAIFPIFPVVPAFGKISLQIAPLLFRAVEVALATLAGATFAAALVDGRAGNDSRKNSAASQNAKHPVGVAVPDYADVQRRTTFMLPPKSFLFRPHNHRATRPATNPPYPQHTCTPFPSFHRSTNAFIVIIIKFVQLSCV